MNPNNENNVPTSIFGCLIAIVLITILLFTPRDGGAQTSMGPIRTPQVNQELFVGEGGYPTIQSAVIYACATGTHSYIVTISPGATPSDQLTALTGGCATTYIQDERSFPEACYSWQAGAYASTPCAAGTSAGTSGGIVSAPTTDQSITQATGTGFSITTTNKYVPGGGGILLQGNNSAARNPDGSGDNGYGAVNLPFYSWGYSKNVGNATALNPNDQGWRTGNALVLRSYCYVAGICQAVHLDNWHYGAGDTAGIYMGNGLGHTPGGWKAASDEDVVGINLNGSQFVNGSASVNGINPAGMCSGHVISTSGNGDIHPVVDCNNNGGVNSLFSNSYLVNLSHPVLVGKLNGTSTGWQSNPFGYAQMPIAGATAVLSTGIGITTTYLAASPTLGVPSPHSFSSTVHDRLRLVNGPCWIISDFYAEQCTISNIGGVGTQTGTIATAFAHRTGSYIFQGGTQGVMSFDADLSKAGNYTDFLVLGATDISHVILAFPHQPGMIATGLPIPGVHAETPTSGFHIYPAALIVSLQTDGLTNILEQNTVPWAVGDAIVSPPPSAYVEEMLTMVSTQNTGSNQGSGGYGFSLTARGFGWSWRHPADYFHNTVPLAVYSGTGSWLDAPTWKYSTGPISTALAFDDPLPAIHGGNPPCGGGTVLCVHNPLHHTNTIQIYQDNGKEGAQIFENRSRSEWTTAFSWQALSYRTRGVGGDSWYSDSPGFPNGVPTCTTLNDTLDGYFARTCMTFDFARGGRWWLSIDPTNSTHILDCFNNWSTNWTNPTCLYLGNEIATRNANVVGISPAAGITSVACVQGLTCTVSRGSLLVHAGTATTGVLFHVGWTNTRFPYVCTISQNGGKTWLGLGHSVPDLGGMNVTSDNSVSGLTFTVDYSCSR